MPQREVFQIDVVEIVYDVSLALLQTLKGPNLRRQGKGLREPGATRIYQNVPRNRWRALTCARPGLYFVWALQTDLPGRLATCTEWAEFFASIADDGGLCEAFEEAAKDCNTRDQRMVERDKKR